MCANSPIRMKIIEIENRKVCAYVISMFFIRLELGKLRSMKIIEIVDWNDKQKIIINDQFVRNPCHLSCKSKHVIYMWICKLCQEKDAYFGHTIQECRNRTSGHRGVFTEEKWDKSALSMHAWEAHCTSFSLDIFSMSIVKKYPPNN